MAGAVQGRGATQMRFPAGLCSARYANYGEKEAAIGDRKSLRASTVGDQT